jgi:hypothetical protein
MQDKFLAANDNRMPGIGPALIARDDIGVLAEQIDDLAFAFIAPLRTDNDLDRHGNSRKCEN